MAISTSFFNYLCKKITIQHRKIYRTVKKMSRIEFFKNRIEMFVMMKS